MGVLLGKFSRMRKIPVRHNEFALIDNDDYERVSQYQWWCSLIKSNGSKYAKADVIIGKKKTTIFMHRLILSPIGKIRPLSKAPIDHINGNSLDNRKKNIRFCTQAENCRNSKKIKIKSSRFKGVSFVEHLTNKWCSKIMLNRKGITIGFFDTEIKAAKAYNKKAKELFGAFAWLNQI